MISPLIQRLLQAEDSVHGRWRYWLAACHSVVVPQAPIPHIVFTNQPDPKAAKYLQNDLLRPYCQASGVSYDDAWLQLVRWVLRGLGIPDLRVELPDGIDRHWQEVFSFTPFLQSPIDWTAFVLQGGLPDDKPGRSRWSGAGYFSTPMAVSNLMVQMNFAGINPDDAKLMTVCDPCCGSGSLLLAASNYSLRLFGMDIVYELILGTQFNGWLYAPWVVLMPGVIRDLFHYYDNKNQRAAPPTGTQLITNPAKVEATKAYRAGDLAQQDFLAALGI